jgi:hypothetical protein
LEFNIKPKTTPTQIATLKKEVIFSAPPMSGCLVSGLQCLLSKNRYLVISNPIEFTAVYIGIGKDHFRNSFEVETNESGQFVIHQKYSINSTLFTVDELSLIDKDRLPLFGIVSKEDCSFRSKEHAIMGYCLHVLFNGRKQFGVSWSTPFLLYTKELLILLPASENLHALKIVATIYRGTKRNLNTPIYGRYICETDMKPTPPFEIDVDQIGSLK